MEPVMMEARQQDVYKLALLEWQGTSTAWRDAGPPPYDADEGIWRQWIRETDDYVQRDFNRSYQRYMGTDEWTIGATP